MNMLSKDTSQVGDPREGWSKTFSFYTRSLHPDADVRVFAFADQVLPTASSEAATAGRIPT